MNHSNNSQQSCYFSSRSQTPPPPDDDEVFFPAIEEVEALAAEEDDIFHDILNDNDFYSKNPEDDFDEFFEPATTRARHCYDDSTDSNEVLPWRSPQHESSSATVSTATKEYGGGGGSVSGGSTIETEDRLSSHDTESLLSDNTKSSNNSETDQQLAKELYELSIHERQRMMNELHCIPDEIDDSPEDENKALQELQEWITQHYHTEQAAAYRTAESISKDFVNSRDLRLKFLRGVMDYEIEKAGARFFSHLTFKLDLFGEAKLCNERITLDDLSEDDLECLRSGCYQVLPVRDSGERAIAFMNCNALKYKSWENTIRACYYMFMTLSEEEDFQKKGIVFMTLGLQFGNNMRYLGYQLLYNMAKAGFSTPSRAVAVHHCLSPGISGTMISWFSSFLPPRARIRTRIHVGTHAENVVKLMSHGIPTRHLPILDEAGTVDLSWHTEWMEIRKKIDARYLKQKQQQEQQQQKQTVEKEGSTTAPTDTENPASNNNNDKSNDEKQAITVPSPKDILMGRGKRTMTAPGNLRLYMVLDDHYERYEACARHLKYKIAQEMVDLVKSQGCRFLVQVDGFWFEADDVKARDKVSHDFRTIRSSKKGGKDSKDKNAKTTTKRHKRTKRSRQPKEEQETN